MYTTNHTVKIFCLLVNLKWSSFGIAIHRMFDDGIRYTHTMSLYVTCTSKDNAEHTFCSVYTH